MIGRFWGWLTHRERTERTDQTVHALNSRAQVEEVRRHLIARSRETGNFLEDYLRGGTPRDRGGQRP